MIYEMVVPHDLHQKKEKHILYGMAAPIVQK